MKKILILSTILLCAGHMRGQERRFPTVIFAPPAVPANSPSGSPAGSVIRRAPTVESFDSIREPKAAVSECSNACICVACLTKASCELEKIQHKLPFLKALIKSPKAEAHQQGSGPSGPQAIAAARMMARLKAVSKESKQLDESLQRVKKKASHEQKETKKEKKEHKIKDSSLKNSGSSRRFRLTTSSDKHEREEFNQLTDPKQTSFKWEIRQASADI